MLILVNVFALASLFCMLFNKITPMAFLVGSLLWIILMVSFWFILPGMVYRRAVTFKHNFSMDFEEDGFTLGHEKGSNSWAWKALKHFIESPIFFIYISTAVLFSWCPKTDAGIKMKCMNCGNC